MRDLVIYLLLRYYSYQTSLNSGGRKYNLWCAGVWVLLFASCSMRERQTTVKLKAAVFRLVTWSRFTYFQLEFGAYSQNVTEVKNWQDAKGDIYVAYDKTVVVRVRIKNTRVSQNRWRSAGCQITVSFWLMGVREKLPQGEMLERLSPRFLEAFSQVSSIAAALDAWWDGLQVSQDSCVCVLWSSFKYLFRDLFECHMARGENVFFFYFTNVGQG